MSLSPEQLAASRQRILREHTGMSCVVRSRYDGCIHDGGKTDLTRRRGESEDFEDTTSPVAA